MEVLTWTPYTPMENVKEGWLTRMQTRDNYAISNVCYLKNDVI